MSDSFIFVLNAGVYSKILTKNILYVQSNDNYCEFSMVDGKKIVVRMTLTKLEEELVELGFYRCHRSYLINVLFIQQLDTNNNTISLEQGDIIPVSRGRRSIVSRLGKVINQVSNLW